MIALNEISSDDSLARRVLVRARSIAPCLDTLEGEPRLDAIAILTGVVAEIPPRAHVGCGPVLGTAHQ